MKRPATPSSGLYTNNHAPSFQPVCDTRKRKVPGLWLRGSRYYVQLRVDLGNGTTAPRRIALEADTLDKAKAEMERKRTEKRDGRLAQPGHRPKFEAFADEYLGSATLAQKKPGTQENEQQAISRWKAHLGGIRVDKITATTIFSFREKRLGEGVSARTVNLDVVALRNVLKFAVERGHIQQIPPVKQLKQTPPPERSLLTLEEFGRLLSATVDKTLKNGLLFRYYIQFLILSGAREQETLAIRWSDVDFKREVVTIGRGGVAKNRRQRDVDFSPELRVLLAAMAADRPPDSSWLFPSPQRGRADKPAKTLRETLNIIRTKADLPKVGFHDLRHYFASGCVMAGLDFMTIASWLGHSDGGILVGKVYGHLAESHKKAAAQKLRLLQQLPS